MKRGLSLLEVVVSVTLLATLLAAMLALYGGALRGLRKAEDNQESLARLDTLVGMVQHWARVSPPAVPFATLSLSRAGVLGGLEYRVEDLGRVEDLDLKRVRVTVFDRKGSYGATLFVGR